MKISEDVIKKKYESLGFNVIHSGAPDFLVFKYDKQKLMTDIQFIEVKTDGRGLTPSQLLWRQALEELNCKYKVDFFKQEGYHE